VQVQLLNVIDQSGITTQSVGTFKITGPSTLKKPVLQVCTTDLHSTCTMQWQMSELD
jgi:hypothetical protein